MLNEPYELSGAKAVSDRAPNPYSKESADKYCLHNHSRAVRFQLREVVHGRN